MVNPLVNHINRFVIMSMNTGGSYRWELGYLSYEGRDHGAYPCHGTRRAESQGPQRGRVHLDM